MKPFGEEGEDARWVCGKVRGKNTFGGYAQPTSFIGMLWTGRNGGRHFTLITIADPYAASELLVLNACIERLKETL